MLLSDIIYPGSGVFMFNRVWGLARYILRFLLLLNRVSVFKETRSNGKLALWKIKIYERCCWFIDSYNIAFATTARVRGVVLGAKSIAVAWWEIGMGLQHCLERVTVVSTLIDAFLNLSTGQALRMTGLGAIFLIATSWQLVGDVFTIFALLERVWQGFLVSTIWVWPGERW